MESKRRRIREEKKRGKKKKDKKKPPESLVCVYVRACMYTMHVFTRRRIQKERTSLFTGKPRDRNDHVWINKQVGRYVQYYVPQALNGWITLFASQTPDQVLIIRGKMKIEKDTYIHTYIHT